MTGLGSEAALSRTAAERQLFQLRILKADRLLSAPIRAIVEITAHHLVVALTCAALPFSQLPP